MKKLFILSLAALGFVACEKRPDYVILSGKIANYMGTSSLQLVGNEDFKKELKVKEDGSFLDTLSLKSSYYTLLDQSLGVYLPLYLKQGDEVALTIDFSKADDPIKISGKDSISSVYLQKKEKLTRELQQNFMTAFQGGTDGFKKSVTEINQKYADFLKNFQGLPKDFASIEEKNNNFTILQLKLLYPRLYSRFNNGQQIEMPKEFADELSKIDYDNAADFEVFPQYKDLVVEHFFSKVDLSNPDWNDVITRVKAVKSANIKAYLAKFLESGISPANSSQTNQELLKTIKEFVKDEKAVKRAEERLMSFEKLKEGNVAPSFDFENFAGGKTSSESLKGKLVYIDVWATWCKPCLDEIPALQALEKEYHDKNIAFVSISIDQEKQKWLDFLGKNKSSGIQLYADLSVGDNFASAYDINTIPRFILIDKEGKIINADAPRPSDVSIKELLNKHL